MRPIVRSITGVANDVPVPLDIYLIPFNVSIAVTVSGTITYSVQWTQDDPFNPPAAGLTWFAGPTNLQAATDNEAGSLVSPVRAVRLITTAGTGTATMTINQAGVMG